MVARLLPMALSFKLLETLVGSWGCKFILTSAIAHNKGIDSEGIAAVHIVERKGSI